MGRADEMDNPKTANREWDSSSEYTESHSKQTDSGLETLQIISFLIKF